jgi:hypothetical protein
MPEKYSGNLISSLTETVDELTYKSYAHNRRRFPEVSPERWARVFADAASYETRFQAEIRSMDQARMMGMQRQSGCYED